MSEIPRPDSADISQAANTFLHPGGGGIAIFVRRDEMQPRAAIRLRDGAPGPRDITVELVTMVACLRQALAMVEVALANQLPMPIDDFRDMADIAESEVIAPRIVPATEVRR